MSEEIQNIFQNRLLQLGNSGISVQIAGPEAVSILEAIYQKGRDDSEREIRAAIAKQEAEEYITKAEAMELLGKSENTLWKWNRSGFLPYTKRGGSIFYRRDLVVSILSGNHKKIGPQLRTEDLCKFYLPANPSDSGDKDTLLFLPAQHYGI